MIEQIISEPWARATNLKERAASASKTSGTETFQIHSGLLQDIESAFASGTEPDDTLAPAIAAAIRGGFARPFTALIRLSAQRLEAALRHLLEAYPNPPFDVARIPALLLPSLVQKFGQIVTRTLVLELNIARMEDKLDGQTSQDRFASFLECSSQHDEVLRIIREYPVLARQLAVCSELWLKASTEFISRLCADWFVIREAFLGGGDPGELVEVSNDAGDSHRGGRSVRVLHFAGDFKVVYKPRSLAIDAHFQELLGWTNDRGMQPRLPQLAVLDRGDHGWQQFVSPATCSSREEVARFYGRQGAYLALLYAVAATDFHFENLIAAGEQPYLIDLEAVFHPRLQKWNLSQADHLAMQEIFSSVVAVGLLPARYGAKDPSEGLDMSGMGGAGGQLMPWESLFVANPGTDQMHFQRKRVRTLGASNRPTLCGAPVDHVDYWPALIDGFSLAYRILLEHRGDLLSEEGLFNRLRDDEVRVVLRPTQNYAKLLFESYHPDVLRDALERDRLLDQLWNGAQHDPQLRRAVNREHDDLWNGDIPIFTTTPGSRDLCHFEHEPLTDFLEEPPIAGHRLSHLSEADLERQTWFINASLANTLVGAPVPVSAPRMTSTGVAPVSRPVSREDLLSVSRAAGDRLLQQAYFGDEDVTWIGLGLAPVGPDLYSGLSGISLFLAYLGAVTGNSSYSKVAHRAMATLTNHLDRKDQELKSVGGFSGLGGVVYTLASLASLWGDRELLNQAEGILDSLPALIEGDRELDFIGGSAGCINALLALHSVSPSDRTLARAVQCGELLLRRAQPMNSGVGWPPSVGVSQPLGGVSHGASGFALALFSLYRATGEPRYRNVALQAIEYERTLFSEKEGNWLDVRHSSAPVQGAQPEGTFATAWCHGAPGIGWSRLLLLPYFDDSSVQEEIRVALKTTLAHDFGGDHCLCHGHSGNLEFLLQASRTLSDPQWTDALSRSTRRAFESLQFGQWTSGEPLGVEVPGMMTGTAGIGYQFLRLAEPTLVPSVLSLEAPGCTTF